jgi:hypothetical protein
VQLLQAVFLRITVTNTTIHAFSGGAQICTYIMERSKGICCTPHFQKSKGGTLPFIGKMPKLKMEPFLAANVSRADSGS